MSSRSGLGLLPVTVGCCALLLAAVCLALALNDRSLTFALGVVVAVTGVLVVMIEPYYGLVLYIACAYLRPGDRYPVIESLRLVFWIGAMTTAVWLAQYLIRKRPPLVRHPVQWDLLGLIAAGMISYLPISIRSGLQVIGTGLLKTLAVYLLVANLSRTPLRLKRLSWVVVILSALNAWLAWQELRAGESRFEARAAGVGWLADPNDLALTLVIALPLALALLSADRGFYRRPLAVACAASLIFGVVISRSRGGMLGLMVVLFLEGYERLRSRRARRLFTITGLVLGLLAVSALAASRGHGLGSLTEDPNVYNRKGAWVAGMRMLLDRPLTGVGLYRFHEWVDLYGPPYLEQRVLTAHNSFILVAGEMGVAGLLFFTLFIVHAVGSAKRVRKLLTERRAPRVQEALGRALGRSLAGWLVCGFFLSQSYQVWLYLIVGLLVATETSLREAAARDEQAA